MIELPLAISAEEALAECCRRGLVVASRRELAGRAGSNHWHLHVPGKTGTLELSELRGTAWVKVHPLRQGTWAVGLAQELAALQKPG